MGVSTKKKNQKEHQSKSEESKNKRASALLGDLLAILCGAPNWPRPENGKQSRLLDRSRRERNSFMKLKLSLMANFNPQWRARVQEKHQEMMD